MGTGYKRIKILSEAEISDLYSLPQFTLEERIVYFSLNKQEKLLIQKIPDLPSKVHAILQLGYFKAKGRLFSFKYHDVLPDIDYILTQYFVIQDKYESILLKAKKEETNKRILALLNYRTFDAKARKELVEQALLLVRIHANHIDIFRELLSQIQIKQIVLPGYTILQDIISLSISIEFKRIENILRENIPKEFDTFLSGMTKSESAINLPTLRVEPKNFKHTELKAECAKSLTYLEYYKLSKQLIDKFEISPKCIRYYASIADEYNIYRLEQLSKPLRKLYLLCYINQRYKEVINNLVTGFIYYNNNFIQEANEYANKQFMLHTIYYNNILPKVSTLLKFMGCDAEQMEYKSFWQTAYDILPKNQYLPTAEYIVGQTFDFQSAKWEFYVNKAKRIKANLRMLFRSIEFCSIKKDDDLMQAILFLKDVFDKDLPLNKVTTDKFPDKFISKNIRKYLRISKNDSTAKSESTKQTRINSDKATTINAYHPDKYEFYLYQSIVKEIDKGNIFCNESTKYKSLSADLVSDKVWQNKDELIQKLNYPNIAVNIEQRLDELEVKLHTKILEVNRKIASKENSYIKIKESKTKDDKIDKNSKIHHKWHLINPTIEEKDDNFFAGVPNINISELLYFINEQTNFCEAFDHIKPRYSKQKADDEGIIACIVANGFSFGTYRMSRSCDISYSTLSNIEKNFLSLENLREANDIISNKIASLKVFNSWNILPDKLLAAVDGQKFETRLDTMQSRYSPKYFGLKKGIVPFSMVLNHVPINCKIIGANEHESHYTYDIIYNNTSEVEPDAVSGDMHSINRVNFAVLDSISKLFMPNFSDPEEQVKSLRSMKHLVFYKDCFIKPTKLANRKLIIEEWENIQRIFVSLAIQESTQATIISKLSSHKRYSRIKIALWEYDSILKSIYLLDFIDDEIMRSQIRKALNRVESYHQLRKAIAKVHSGKFRGQTILENEVWNQCSRLLANSIILYNAIILDKLLAECIAQGNIEGINYLNSISPVRWEHINFIGKYVFLQAKSTINIEDIIAQLQKNLKTTLYT
jgi:TnpA family transposase